MILLVLCLTGLIAYAIYHDCDLLSAKIVTIGEQILPYLVMDLLNDLPGFPGLFVACVYSAALSTISSGLNSLATVSIKDFIQPFYANRRLLMNEANVTNISKVLAFLFGLITVGLAFVCKYLGATVLQIVASIFGIFGGPLLGTRELFLILKT